MSKHLMGVDALLYEHWEQLMQEKVPSPSFLGDYARMKLPCHGNKGDPTDYSRRLGKVREVNAVFVAAEYDGCCVSGGTPMRTLRWKFHDIEVRTLI